MRSLTVLIGALAIVGYANGLTIELPEWESFKFNYNKVYPDLESESVRQNIFAKNKKYIESFNENAGESGFTLAINHFADMSPEELRLTNGLKTPSSIPRNTLKSEQYLQSIYNRDAPIPNELDWRKVPGRVTKAKDQKLCGACWTFASTGVLEGQQKVHPDYMKEKHDDIVPLSEQNLVDCVKKDFGCGGGLMMDAFDYVKQNGIESEQAYPYKARNRRCHFNKTESVMSDKGFAMLPQGDEEKLKEVVAKYGPVSVAIDDSNPNFHYYEKGVYKDYICGNAPKNLGHAILVVGYGTDPTEGDYWIIKNSWSEHWGQKGFGLFARNQNNMCGITTMASIAAF